MKKELIREHIESYKEYRKKGIEPDRIPERIRKKIEEQSKKMIE